MRGSGRGAAEGQGHSIRSAEGHGRKGQKGKSGLLARKGADSRRKK